MANSEAKNLYNHSIYQLSHTAFLYHTDHYLNSESIYEGLALLNQSQYKVLSSYP